MLDIQYFWFIWSIHVMYLCWISQPYDVIASAISLSSRYSHKFKMADDIQWMRLFSSISLAILLYEAITLIYLKIDDGSNLQHRVGHWKEATKKVKRRRILNENYDYTMLVKRLAYLPNFESKPDKGFILDCVQ